MAKVPPKAFYTLRIANRMRKGVHRANLYDYEDEDEDADQMTCDLFLIHFNVERELHLDRSDSGNKDTYLPISSLLNLWFIIKAFQQYYQNH